MRGGNQGGKREGTIPKKRVEEGKVSSEKKKEEQKRKHAGLDSFLRMVTAPSNNLNSIYTQACMPLKDDGVSNINMNMKCSSTLQVGGTLLGGERRGQPQRGTGKNHPWQSTSAISLCWPSTRPAVREIEVA